MQYSGISIFGVMGKVTGYKSILISLAVIVVFIPISSPALIRLDPNGCTIVISHNESGAVALDGQRYEEFDTAEKCLQFCIGLVSPEWCIAVEFNSNKTDPSNFGCWAHTNPADLKELFGSDPWITHYQILRSGCPGATRRVGEANIDTSPPNTAALINVAQIALLLVPATLLFGVVERCRISM